MIERKWKPENHKLEDAFFPVALCDLKFVYPAETDLFGKVVRTKDVLADFASYPRGVSGVNTVPVLQAKAGAWIDEFVEASDTPGFNMTNYLGADAIEAATWYDSLTAA